MPPANTTHLIVDSEGRVYVAFRQSDGSLAHLYLARYDRTTVGIWDNDTSSFSDTFANADPIDRGSGSVYSSGFDNLDLEIDSQARVYIAFIQYDGSQNRLYLTRYDGTDVNIWDNSTSTFTDTFSNGDPITPHLSGKTYLFHLICSDGTGSYNSLEQ